MGFDQMMDVFWRRGFSRLSFFTSKKRGGGELILHEHVAHGTRFVAVVFEPPWYGLNFVVNLVVINSDMVAAAGVVVIACDRVVVNSDTVAAAGGGNLIFLFAAAIIASGNGTLGHKTRWPVVVVPAIVVNSGSRPALAG